MASRRCRLLLAAGLAAVAQCGSSAASAQAGLERIRISVNGTFETASGERVQLLGGNYVVKAHPYFVPLDVVRADARAFAESARATSFVPRTGARIAPCVRLGVLWEAAMPQQAGPVDKAWLANVSATVQVFSEEGVYVFFDFHSDALSTTNGGVGLPWWVAAGMQTTAHPGQSFVVAPEHPLRSVLPQILERFFKEVPVVKTAENQTDPWRAYSVGNNAGHPSLMNVGNVNVRLNNNDKAWAGGVLLMTAQVHNLARRFYTSYKDPQDKKNYFDVYVDFLLSLCRLWEQHSNVVAIEVLNEPPLGGLPDIPKLLSSRVDLWNFYAAVLQELDRAEPPVKAPVALEDIGGSLPGAGAFMDFLSFEKLPKSTKDQLRHWSSKQQLILAFHWYPGNILTSASLHRMVDLAKAQAKDLGGRRTPVLLSEFFAKKPQLIALKLAEASNLGCDAVTYWHYVNRTWTNTSGWFRYSSEIMALGQPINMDRTVNWKAWRLYEKTVADGSFWGGPITGAGGGQMNVLDFLPNTTALEELVGQEAFGSHATALLV